MREPVGPYREVHAADWVVFLVWSDHITRVVLIEGCHYLDLLGPYGVSRRDVSGCVRLARERVWGSLTLPFNVVLLLPVLLIQPSEHDIMHVHRLLSVRCYVKNRVDQ